MCVPFRVYHFYVDFVSLISDVFIIVLIHKLTPILKPENILSVDNYKQIVVRWKNVCFLFEYIIYLWTLSV